MHQPLKHTTDVVPPPVSTWVLTLLVFSGTLAMHIFVPALPLVARDLNAGMAAVQQTVSFYILGLAGAQLIYGPLSDRFGRRHTLMAGLVLYLVAGIASALAADANTLVIARLFQALGGGAGLVIGRAIVRDTSTPAETVRRIAGMNLFTTAGPALAPIVGSILASEFGWRSIFWVLVGLGVVNILLAWRLLPETNLTRGSEPVSALAKNYARLLRTPRFLASVLGAGCATTTMYAFIAAAPFMFVQQMGASQYEVGFFLAILVLGIVIASGVSTRINLRFPSKRVLIFANLMSLIFAALFLATVLTDHLNAYVTVALMFVFMFGVGLAAPAAFAEAMNVDRRVVGSASGLYGFAQMIVGAFSTALVGLGDDPALAAGLILVIGAVIAQLAFRFALSIKVPKPE
jgi:DHA1 family bicyclomycin/chloramphenicol resistance-like MFS transporter